MAADQKRRRIKASFDDFFKHSYPAGVSDWQRREIEKVFYAGALSAWSAFLGTLDVDDEEGLTSLTEVQAEFDEFNEGLQRELATLQDASARSQRGPSGRG